MTDGLKVATDSSFLHGTKTIKTKTTVKTGFTCPWGSKLLEIWIIKRHDLIPGCSFRATVGLQNNICKAKVVCIQILPKNKKTKQKNPNKQTKKS